MGRHLAPSERLEHGGIPLDWTTLFLGWDGHGDQNGPVTTAQMPRYALDRIGYGPEEEFDLLSGLALAEERDTWTIRASVAQLASDTPEAWPSGCGDGRCCLRWRRGWSAAKIHG